MANENNIIRPGVYNIEYFSGAQVAIYFGHIWIDEITSMSFSVSQSRTPLYGYSDQLWRDVAEGQVLVRGQFSINFKEAGYIWVALNEYKRINKNGSTPLNPFTNTVLGQPDSGSTNRINVEQVINRELSQFDLNRIYTDLASQEGGISEESAVDVNQERRNITAAKLTGFSSTSRSSGGIGTAENIFEAFEDMAWGKSTERDIDEEDHRRADDTRLNPFDIYITYGDFPGGTQGNVHNHTIRKMTDVYIIGTSQQVVIDGQPIQEVYDFIARNIV